jgi:hypothetical protein
MKKPLSLVPVVLPTILALTVLSFTDIQKASSIPSDVEKVVANSCYACHTTGANAKDAVKALDFKLWDDYSKTRKIAKLNDIQEVLGEGTMPPGKFVSKNPGKALSEEDRDLVLKWAKKEISGLME